MEILAWTLIIIGGLFALCLCAIALFIAAHIIYISITDPRRAAIATLMVKYGYTRDQATWRVDSK